VVFAPPATAVLVVVLVVVMEVLVMVVALEVVFEPQVPAVQAPAMEVALEPLVVVTVLVVVPVVAMEVLAMVVALEVVFAPPVPDVLVAAMEVLALVAALVAAPPLPDVLPVFALEVLALVPAPRPHAAIQVFGLPSLVPPQMALSLKPHAAPPVPTKWSSKHQGSYSSLLGCSYNPMLYFHTKL